MSSSIDSPFSTSQTRAVLSDDAVTSSDESAEKQQSQNHIECPVCWLFSAKSFLTSKIFEERSDDVVALKAWRRCCVSCGHKSISTQRGRVRRRDRRRGTHEVNSKDRAMAKQFKRPNGRPEPTY